MVFTTKVHGRTASLGAFSRIWNTKQDDLMRELPQHAIARVSGPAWEQLRRQFIEIGELLLDVSADARSDLFTTYVRFTTHASPESPAYAAVWYKSSKRLIVGLALPVDCDAAELGPALPGTVYKGLSKYFVVERGSAVPKGLAEWAGLAYQNALSTEPSARVAGFVDQHAVKETEKQGRARPPLRRAG
jgi:hypothetical protein